MIDAESYQKHCLDCVRAESRYVPAEGEYLNFCTFPGTKKGKIAPGTEPCENWYPRRFAALPPNYSRRREFPSCPVCGARLEVYCRLDGKRCGDVPFFNYCPGCGQKIDREKGGVDNA